MTEEEKRGPPDIHQFTEEEAQRLRTWAHILGWFSDTSNGVKSFTGFIKGVVQIAAWAAATLLFIKLLVSTVGDLSAIEAIGI